MTISLLHTVGALAPPVLALVAAALQLAMARRSSRDSSGASSAAAARDEDATAEAVPLVRSPAAGPARRVLVITVSVHLVDPAAGRGDQ